ncbi:uncharacterized protein V2V93DRAFT_402238 [Kockiozyma suomiensis]|uniref:uncharacterized protein n=1 Tax=Kockiozyma suomiensis TaxID=1337062 RepID=UPI0033433A07
MDLSALLAKEIAKKKAAAVSAQASSASTSADPPKYLRRADIEAQRAKQYREEQDKRERARQLEQEQRRREKEEEEERREKKRVEAAEKYLARKRAQEELEEQERRVKKSKKGGQLLENIDKKDDESSKTAELENASEEQLVERLRQVQEPARLFDESREERIRRLLRAETRAAKKSATPEQRLAEVEMVIEEDHLDDEDKINMQIEKYIRYLLREWEKMLLSRENTPEQAFATLEQTKTNLGPLLSRLEHKSLHNDIRPRLATLISHMQHKRYRDANDCYLKLSIGNAAWPIGVTAVGIHARSARERITGDGDNRKTGLAKSQQIAHIMSDERTRKWLTAVKRLITFAESQWPE